MLVEFVEGDTVSQFFKEQKGYPIHKKFVLDTEIRVFYEQQELLVVGSFKLGLIPHNLKNLLIIDFP